MARLAVANHLTIPFQEVRVGVSFTESSSRRLLEVRNVYFKATVDTKRMNKAYGERLLDMLIADVEFARELLGVDIRRIEILGNVAPGQQRIMEMGEFNDPYSPAYQEIQPSPNDATHSLLDTLSQEVILGIAAGVVIFFISVVTVLCYWRRRQARQAREALEQKRVEKKVSMDNVEEDATDDLEKPGNNAEAADQAAQGPKFATQIL